MLGDRADSYSILEHQVDVTLQLEYFEYSHNHPPVADAVELLAQEANLYLPSADAHDIRSLLVSFASIDRPEAYRVLERYLKVAPPELRDWATMALHESRMLLESQLLEEHQVFISTGLGGRDGKLRYFVVIFPLQGNEFTPTQQRLIKTEFGTVLKNYDGDVEAITFQPGYATLTTLIPLSVAVKAPLEQAIDECNSLGEFIQNGFIVTNVKNLTDKEIGEILNPPSAENENT